MNLRIDQWIVLLIGVVGLIVVFYGKTQGWDYDTYFPIFYASISMCWIAFLNDRKTCRKRKAKRLQGASKNS